MYECGRGTVKDELTWGVATTRARLVIPDTYNHNYYYATAPFNENENIMIDGIDEYEKNRNKHKNNEIEG